MRMRRTKETARLATLGRFGRRNCLTADGRRPHDTPALMNPAGASPEPAGSKPKPLIVVVDDELMVGDVVQAMLELGGYRTIYFQDPRKALEWLQEPYTHPDLILTDFLMPHLTGLELLQGARAARPGLKAILYSGHVEERESDNYPERPHRFLRKPFSARTLIGVVKSVLEGSPQDPPK